MDYYRLCRDTAHAPLVQAAIDPAHINVWSERESRRAGRYEQYSFKTQRIDVRVEHDISLYHGLIHRTLDLIGESQWKHRDFAPHEDEEHWLIYHTLESHWPGLQRAQGGEPSAPMLAFAGHYWRQHAARYAEIAAKATTLAELSWCALNMPRLEAMQQRPPGPTPQQSVAMRAVPPQTTVEPVSVARVADPVAPVPAPTATEVASLTPATSPGPQAIEEPQIRPVPQAQPQPQAEPAPQQPASQTRVQQPLRPLKQSLSDLLAADPISVMSEFLLSAPAAPAQRPSLESQWTTSPDQSALPVPQPLAQRPAVEPLSPQPTVPWTPAQSIWATPAERAAGIAMPQQTSSTYSLK